MASDEPILNDEQRERLTAEMQALLLDYRAFLELPFTQRLLDLADERQETFTQRCTEDLSQEETARVRAHIHMFKDIAHGRLFDAAYRRAQRQLTRSALREARTERLLLDASGGSGAPGGAPRRRRLA